MQAGLRVALASKNASFCTLHPSLCAMRPNPILTVTRTLPLMLVLLLTGFSTAAQAWWNESWSQRTRITLNTSNVGIETREALSQVAVPVRLHSGNFDFLAAKPDGSDLRVVAGDDKTPLKFRIERFDGANELAVLWVEVPAVAPGSDKNQLYVYFGNTQAAAEPPAAVADAGTAAAIRFAEADGSAADHTGTLRASAPATVELNGLIGPSARLSGTAIGWPASERVRAAAGAPYAVSLWVRPESAAGTLFAQGPLSLALAGGAAQVRLGAVSVSGGALPPNAWAQIAVVVAGGQLTLYVNGTAAGNAAVPAAPAIDGGWSVGAGFSGLVDELAISTAARSAEFLRFNHAAQSADAKLVASVLQPQGATAAGEEGGHGGYMGVLVKNLTVDAWVVIVLCGVLFVIAAWVMVDKFMLVRRTEAGNQGFLARFREVRDVMQAEGTSAHPSSSLARIYEAGLRELKKRDVGQAGAARLSGASMDAVRAAVDADVVRENNRMNSHMVWLTIAISGGPFLGLLGTVVGVMITFAAIAAAGDVNVNAIAPGIAAALLATVAGLGVAIPALFGYNYLTTGMKTISSDMQIFVDEFVTRVAESYGER
jgi:biopolymer transport protein ExbB